MRYSNNIIQDLVYQPFYADFGPLSLGKTWKYITELEKLLGQENLKKTNLYHYTSTDSAKCANAAYLMGAFQVYLAINLGGCAQTIS
jgi:cell division cycle 14